MPRYRITFDVSTRVRTTVNAATEALARRKIRDTNLGDQAAGTGINPQPVIDTEITNVDVRRRIISVVEL